MSINLTRPAAEFGIRWTLLIQSQLIPSRDNHSSRAKA
jgi:hypothetical protein